jgi:hypothetical protein
MQVVGHNMWSILSISVTIVDDPWVGAMPDGVACDGHRIICAQY